MQNQVKHKQSVLDLTIQNYGSLNALLDFVLENKTSITEELQAGSFYEVPSSNNDTIIVEYFKAKKITPATELKESEKIVLENKGIGFMEIGNNFIIS